MTVTTLRLTPGHRQVYLDQHYGEAMRITPQITPSITDSHLLRGVGFGLGLEALVGLIGYLIGRATGWIGG